MRRSVYVPFGYVRFGRGSCAGAQLTAKFRLISEGFVHDLPPQRKNARRIGRRRFNGAHLLSQLRGSANPRPERGEDDGHSLVRNTLSGPPLTTAQRR